MRFLLATRTNDYWEDFDLPVGSSDAWITAYVCLALVRAQHAMVVPAALDAAERGADWLQDCRPYAQGWGYNGITGPDADSTSWVLRALKALGRVARPQDVAFLRAHSCSNGGIRTYLHGPEHWGVAHPDVTPVAVLALADGTSPTIVREALVYLHKQRRKDGSWPAYWWSTSHYSTLQNVELREELGLLNGDERPVVSARPEQQAQTAFDLACVLETAAITGLAKRRLSALTAALLGLQREDGSWPASAALLVTDPRAAHPRDEDRAKAYRDVRGVLTTAAAVRALVRAGSC